MISRIWKEEKNTVIGLFISVLAGMLLITTIWKMITQRIFPLESWTRTGPPCPSPL